MSLHQGVQAGSDHLPVLRIGLARLQGTRLRPLRLLRVASARLPARDLARRGWPPRRPGRPRLRVRPSRDAQPARRRVPLPGVRLGGLARRGSSRRPTKKGSPMVRYMSLEEQVDADFTRARRRAFLRRISARLRKRPIPNRLLCFEEVSRKLGVAGGVRRGRRTVRLTDIVGSVSRCSEFDGAFLPLRESARTKWEHIDRVFLRGEELPPVSLYRIGSSYFVEDGNHRVSVYRYQGVEFIDAEVTEFRALLPGDRKDEGRLIHHPSSGAGDANVDGRLLVGAAATLAGGGLDVVPGMEDAMASTQSEVSALLESWSEAIRIKDIDRLMSLYSPDIVYFDLVPGLQYTE